MANSSSTPVNNVSSETVNFQATVQLPRIQLPEFDGTFNDWIRFRDLFESLIHNKTNLSNIEKFEYLQSHLKGDALSVIKHLNLSNENYTVGWNLIKNKFNNSELLKRNYLKLLFDQPGMRSTSAMELKRLINNTNEGYNALKALNEPVFNWGSLLVFHLEKKLDSETHVLWCRSSKGSETFAKFQEFLEQRLRELENCQANKSYIVTQTNKQRPQANIHTTLVKECPACQQAHQLFNCEKFKALNVNDRINMVKRNNLCFNCLQSDHTATNCVRSTCRTCHAKHNTLLHRSVHFVNSNNMQNMQQGPSHNNAQNINTVSSIANKVTLLPTALVMVLSADQEYKPFRVLLDTGAQASLISEDCVRQLHLRRSYDRTQLCGIGNESKMYARGKVQIVIKSRLDDKTISTTALCVQKLSQLLPACMLLGSELDYFKNLYLADPQCNTPNHIDLILGADVFGEWFLNQQIVHPSGGLSALSTIFGWVIIGNISANQGSAITVSHVSLDISEQLQKFWNIEEVHEAKEHMTEEEQQAEEHYRQTVSRDTSGRYIVRLPFKPTIHNLGCTKMQATKRLHNMELKFKNNENLRQEYVKFMSEYIELGHMRQANQPNIARFHLPHHAVIKLQSSTTKLRVVFDGSAKCSNGTSLNNHLLIGPTIQRDIFTILLQFRKFKIALSGDIAKMYRQIIVHPDDRRYQCILWRPDNQHDISTYELNTVTYGTSAAPFLATRTLKQIAIDNEKEFPEMSNVIMKCFYVDDFMASIPSEEDALQLKVRLCNILANAGLHLRKWSSNSTTLLQTIEVADREASVETIIDDSHTVKTLGLYWNTELDVFKYRVSLAEEHQCITKRVVLSLISRVFDPLGWLAPIVIAFKIFMQKLWLRGIDWDAELPTDMLQQWNIIYKSMNAIKEVQIPRWLQYSAKTHVQLHGFADSSEWAYAAVIYLKVIRDDGSISSTLVASKTRVAPVKQVTLPRLELCACQLLTKLMVKVRDTLEFENVELFGWTDSTIVLAWLADHPRRWKNFVANRTSFTHEHSASTSLATHFFEAKSCRLSNSWVDAS